MKLRTRIGVIVLFLFSFSKIEAQTVIAPTERSDLFNYVEQLKEDPCLKNSSWGLKVVNLKNGFEVISHNGNLGFTPASVTKLFTTATAWLLLGSNFKFTTELRYSGEINSDGVLNGDLIIKGGGDPTLGSEKYKSTNLETILAFIKLALDKAGVIRINGRIIGDASIFEYALTPNTWLWEDLGIYYGAGASGLTLNENILNVKIEPADSVGKNALIVDIEPMIPNLKIINEVKTVATGTTKIEIFGSEYSNIRIVRGSIPIHAKNTWVRGTIPDPELSAASILYEFLSTNGIEVVRGAASKRELIAEGEKLQESTQVLSSIQSVSLKEIVRIVNLNSNNLFAEHLHKALSMKKIGVGSNDVSNKLIQDFWASRGLDASTLFIADGSGLSRLNYISPHNLTLLLKEMFNQKDAKDFLETLPVLGKSGTLSALGKSIKNSDKLMAKSGSMNRVRCYSGYVKNNKNEDWAFAVMFNNFNCSQNELLIKIETLFDKMIKSD